MKIKQLKKELKELSLKIRTAKSVYKEGQRKSDSKKFKSRIINMHL